MQSANFFQMWYREMPVLEGDNMHVFDGHNPIKNESVFVVIKSWKDNNHYTYGSTWINGSRGKAMWGTPDCLSHAFKIAARATKASGYDYQVFWYTHSDGPHNGSMGYYVVLPASFDVHSFNRHESYKRPWLQDRVLPVQFYKLYRVS